jgi:hypothetical protein
VLVHLRRRGLGVARLQHLVQDAVIVVHALVGTGGSG